MKQLLDTLQKQTGLSAYLFNNANSDRLFEFIEIPFTYMPIAKRCIDQISKYLPYNHSAIISVNNDGNRVSVIIYKSK